MATVTYIREARQSAGAMKRLMAYCCREEKVTHGERRYVSGVNCDGENAFDEFMLTKNAYRKTEGMSFYQYVQSFSPEEGVTYGKAHEIARAFAARAWPGHEVLVTTHCDAPHVHTHFVINSVSFETGRKLRQHPGTLKELRAVSDEICLSHGLSVLKPYEGGGAKLSPREYRAADRGESWKFRLMAVIEEAMERSGSREEFLTELRRRHYDATWTPERKYITYTCPGGMKCRDIRLHDEKYRKENMEDEFAFRESFSRGASEEFSHRHASAEERRGPGEAGADALRDEGLRDSRGAAQRGAPAPESGGGVSAGAVSAAQDHGDQGGAGGPRFGDHAGRAGLLAGSDGYPGRGVPADGGSPAGDRITGWESARELYLEMRFHLGGEPGKDRDHGQRPAEADSPAAADQRRHGGGNLPLGVLALLEAGRLIEEDEEDSEERRRKMEARESAENLGAVLGLAAGLAAAAGRRGAADRDAPEEDRGPVMGGMER